MPFFTNDPFEEGKKLKVFADEYQIAKMIESGIEDYRIDRIDLNNPVILISDTFWNRRKLKKLKIKFKK